MSHEDKPFKTVSFFTVRLVAMEIVDVRQYITSNQPVSNDSAFLLKAGPAQCSLQRKVECEHFVHNISLLIN